MTKEDMTELAKNETWMASIDESETADIISVFTGTPQRTTIQAKTETAVWDISSESLHGIFENKPEVMDNMAADVAQ